MNINTLLSTLHMIVPNGGRLFENTEGKNDYDIFYDRIGIGVLC